MAASLIDEVAIVRDALTFYVWGRRPPTLLAESRLAEAWGAILAALARLEDVDEAALHASYAKPDAPSA